MTREQRELLAKALDQNENYLIKSIVEKEKASDKDISDFIVLVNRELEIIIKELIRLDDERNRAYRAVKVFDEPVPDKGNDFDK